MRREVDAYSLRADGIEPHILDITRESDVLAITARVAGDPLRRQLRALINNAGIAVNAPVETLPIAEWRRLFEVNLFGHVAVIQALLPALLRGSGTVVNITSVGGKFAMATYGAYAGTKFALEAVSDSLRREVEPFGVKVVVVEPGAVQTRMAESAVAAADRLGAKMTPDQSRRYADLSAAISTQQRSHTKDGASVERAAKVIAKAATATNPRTRYTIGSDAAVFVRLTRVASDRLLDRMLRRALQFHYVTNSSPRTSAGRPHRDAACRRLVGSESAPSSTSPHSTS